MGFLQHENHRVKDVQHLNQQRMGSRLEKMSRNKSFLRSSSTTGAYPYPRTHTMLMVVPSNRPPPVPQKTKIFTGVRRRPPLNRACPPIPESKSNESIISHASKISEKVSKTVADASTSDLVIENRNAVDVLHRLDSNSNISATSTSRCCPKKENIKMSNTPRSPLMNVAHSVKSKFSKITKIGRSGTSSSSIKTSQSFSGIRQPKTVPKVVDQNANRVIKSSSMEVPSTSKTTIPQDPRPLNEDKIEEISEIGLIPTAEISPDISEKPKMEPHLSVKLEEDVLVVTKEFDEKYPGQKRSASPDPPATVTITTVTTTETRILEKEVETPQVDENANPEPVIEEELEEIMEKEPEPIKEEPICSPQKFILTCKTPEALRKHKTLVIEETKPVEEIKEEPKEEIKYTRLETVRFKEIKTREPEPEPETKYIMTIKTPEALRRHHTFTIGDKAPEDKEASEPKPKKAAKLTKQKSEPERFISPERYILTVKTPEALRRHHTFTIGVKEDKEEATTETKLAKIAKNPKITKSKTDIFENLKNEQKTKYVMVMKTPEALRRHHTFSIGDRPKSPDYPYIEEGENTEPIATIGPPADRRKKEMEKERKRKEWEEYEKPKEKFILTTTTPVAIRKYQTFVVEPKRNVKGPTLPTSVSADAGISDRKSRKIERSESTDSKKHSYLKRLQFELFRGRSRDRSAEKKAEKRQKSLDERKPPSTQKYVLSTPTPIMMRKYQTFAIVDHPADTTTSTADHIASSYEPVETTDFYSITATTPLAKRKTDKLKSLTDSSTRQISFEDEVVPPTSARKPVSPSLFIMGGRRPTRLDNLDRSQSDKAEHQESTRSGDLTSPEEDIPMDTNPTPTMEEQRDSDVLMVSRRVLDLGTSPIEEEPSILLSDISGPISVPISKQVERPAPVFTPPSPPPVTLVVKSTSTTSASSGESNPSSRSKPTLPQLPLNPMHIVELHPKSNEETVKEKGAKEKKIGSRSLRNAGKMLTPSFLRKNRKNDTKKGYLKTTPTGRAHISEKLERKAPLAEGESSVVANSPLVENLPITFEKWSMKSPRQAHKILKQETIHEDVCLDANANNTTTAMQYHLNEMEEEEELLEEERRAAHRHATTNPPHDTGLIDDDILDQPMLVGDTFSHSSSMDCISSSQHQQQKMSESILTIDRSVAGGQEVFGRNTQENFQPSQNLARIQIDAGLAEVQDIKSQLQRLNQLVNKMGITEWEEEIIRLRRENEQLRREVAEKDATIAALRSQTVTA